MSKLVTTKNHPFHLVSISPWPIYSSISVMILLTGMIQWFFEYSSNLIFMGLISLLMCIYQWWRDVIRESTFQGHHSFSVLNLMNMGMILFIISEIFFFFSFFWMFFHISLSPNIELGEIWPPMTIKMFNPYHIPLLNTIILLTSGISITWCHYSILINSPKNMKISIFFTVTLGIYFSFLQYLEYTESSFSISDSSYGASFFLITGFHGFHVLVGTLFIFISLIRMFLNHFSSSHHFGFEASAWYWHFVDVVWLFVYMFIYWWVY